MQFIYLQRVKGFGGPPKEFHRIALKNVKKRSFDKALREMLSEDFSIIRKLFGMYWFDNLSITKDVERDQARSFSFCSRPQ